MKLVQKLITALAVTSYIATPFVSLTGCAKSDDTYVVDVSNGYTPSDVHKLDSTANSTLSSAMNTWFNHAALNKLTPMEEFKWSMGETAKSIKNYKKEENGIKYYTELKKATAGMTGFEVNDIITRKVSYETKGGLHFNYYIDYREANDIPEGFNKVLYKAEIDLDYDIKMKNISLKYGEKSAILSTFSYLGAMTQGYGISFSNIFKLALPSLVNKSPKLNIFPDLLNLSSKDHTWMFDVFFDASINVIAGDYEYGSYQFKIDREVDYETTLLLEKMVLLPSYIFDILSVVGMFNTWQSYYVDSLCIPLTAERIPLETEDITQPIEITQPSKNNPTSLTIKVRLNDADENDIKMISLGSSIPVFGYSSYFNILIPQNFTVEEKEGKYILTIPYTVQLITDQTGTPTIIPPSIVNETVYLPISNTGKWVASIPVQIRAIKA